MRNGRIVVRFVLTAIHADVQNSPPWFAHLRRSQIVSSGIGRQGLDQPVEALQEAGRRFRSYTNTGSGLISTKIFCRKRLVRMWLLPEGSFYLRTANGSLV